MEAVCLNLWFLVPFGILLVITGIILIIIGSLPKSDKDTLEREKPGSFPDRMQISGGGVIMIGPIPIIFGTDHRYAIIAIILALILMAFVFLFI